MTPKEFLAECHRFLRALRETQWTDEQMRLGFTGLCHAYAKTEDSSSRVCLAYMERCRRDYQRWLVGRLDADKKMEESHPSGCGCFRCIQRSFPVH